MENSQIQTSRNSSAAFKESVAEIAFTSESSDYREIVDSELVSKKPLEFKSNFVSIGGYTMHYLDEGSGPAVLLLHGNPTWCYYYRNLINQLKTKFRVIAPDFIGCGLSSHPSDRAFRASERVEHLQELVKCLGLKKYSLVMHDWGGSLGTALAISNVQAVDRMVYLNTTISETESLPKIIKMAARPLIGKFLTQYSKRFLKFTTDWGVCRKLPKQVRNAYFYPYKSISRRKAIWDFVDDIPFDSTHPTYSLMLEIAGKLPQLADVPVKIVWGLKDPCFHREMLNKVAQHFPQASVLEIPQASHLVLEDAPELAGKTILDFLTADMQGLREQSQVLMQKQTNSGNKSENALFAAFNEMTTKQPQREAVIVPSFFMDNVRYAHMSYSNLSELVNKYQRGLHELGLRSGDKVIMLVPAGIEFLALSYAVMGRGAIPVFIDPGMGRENLLACIEEISPQAFIGSAKAQLLRVRYKKLFAGLRFHVVANDWVFFGGPNLSFLKKFSSKSLPVVSSPGISMIAFTSGATGKPKGVIFNDAMVSEQLRIFREIFKLESGSKDMPLLPIFSLFNLANGICSVFPPIDSTKPLSLEPNKIVKIIHDLRVEYSFGSPTLWTKISEYCVRAHESLQPLKKILMAGAPVPLSTLERTISVMPEGEIFTPYGATEALPVTLVSAREILSHQPKPAHCGAQGTFVGKPVSGLEIKIIEERAEIISTLKDAKELQPFEIGEVIVKGKNVSPQYWDRPDATIQSKIKDENDFWHRMGDVGYLDSEGNLYFCGRKAHIVRIESKTYYSIPVERVFNAHKKVKRSALVSLNNEREAAIVIEPHPEHWPDSPEQRKLLRCELLELAADSNLCDGINKIFFHRSFPVDARHNAKIFRDKLGKWASAIGDSAQ